MNYYSLNRQAPDASFREAVIRGLAPDKGLYFPESITPLPKSFFDNIDSVEAIIVSEFYNLQLINVMLKNAKRV